MAIRLLCRATGRKELPSSLINPHRGTGIAGLSLFPSSDRTPVDHLFEEAGGESRTPLRDLPDLAKRCGAAEFHVKDERERFGLGSFKALGAAYAIARKAAEVPANGNWKTALNGETYVTASAGNHGLSVAAGAALFGAEAVVYLAETVPEGFAGRLTAEGARVVRAGATYEASMEAAEAGARDNGWTLLSDSSWPGYTEMPSLVMEGYLQLAAETAEDMKTPPTHIFLQAGVGGLAAAAAAYFRKVWGDAPQIVVVEPAVAPALLESIRAGKIVTADGPESSMGRLDCKTPSMIALAGLARDADLFVTITEDEVAACVEELKGFDLATTPSGAAGLAAAMLGIPELGSDARVLGIVSECE